MIRPWLVAVGTCALLACAAGCSSSPSPSNECLGSSSAALRKCAAGGTLKGVDVSAYQGTINWSLVKGDGTTFAFIRASDGINTPDSKFAANWPGAKSAGLIRGAYQYFRPSQDPTAQAQLLIDAIDENGGFQPGDLPPVLDLETSSGQSSSVVVSRAQTWLQHVEKALGIKPIVYTANFMSSVIGTAFGAYTLWVANYEASCPLLPSGWSDWHFWQDSDSGKVKGVSGGVDTDLFNGTVAQLQALTLEPASAAPSDGPSDLGVVPSGAIPNDGSLGGTIGSGQPPPEETTGAPIAPCD
jgi:lysozyme